MTSAGALLTHVDALQACGLVFHAVRSRFRRLRWYLANRYQGVGRVQGHGPCSPNLASALGQRTLPDGSRVRSLLFHGQSRIAKQKRRVTKKLANAFSGAGNKHHTGQLQFHTDLFWKRANILSGSFDKDAHVGYTWSPVEQGRLRHGLPPLCLLFGFCATI